MPFEFTAAYRWTRPRGDAVIVAGVLASVPDALPKSLPAGTPLFEFRQEQLYRAQGTLYGALLIDTSERLVVRDAFAEAAGTGPVDHVFEPLTLARLREMAEAVGREDAMRWFTSDRDVQTYYSEMLLDGDWADEPTRRAQAR